MCNLSYSCIVLVTITLLFPMSATSGDIDPLDPVSGEFLDFDPLELEQLALDAYLEGDFLLAAELYLDYLRWNTDDAVAIYNLACCYGLLDEPELAAAFLLRGVRAGFTDMDHILWDPDFDLVRSSLVFNEAVDEIAEMILDNEAIKGEGFWFDALGVNECRLMFPDGFDPGERYPLVIGLHGLGDTPEGFIRLWGMFDAPDFIFACPQALYPVPAGERVGFSWFYWNPSSEQGFHSNMIAVEHVISLLNDLEKDFLVSDVYLLGFSQGCTMVWNTGMLYPERFDGLVGFGGWLETDYLSMEVLEKASNSNVYVVHGIDDSAVPFEAGEETYTILSGMGCNSEFRAFEGGHTIDPDALLDAQEWMRSLR